MANANVGDKPQIEEDDEEEDDLFGDKLNTEGKKLRKMMKKRSNGQADDVFGESDSVIRHNLVGGMSSLIVGRVVGCGDSQDRQGYGQREGEREGQVCSRLD